MRITRGLACALLLAGCGDNIHLGGGQFMVSPQADLHTSDRGGTATFMLALTDPPIDPVIVTLASSDASAGWVDPAQLRITRAGYSDPQTITVTGAQNFAVTGPQSYTIHIAALDTPDLDPVDVQVTNDDSDMAAISIAP